jgi:hypothetical protein
MNIDNKIKRTEKENDIMERIFTNALRKQLRQRIKGTISVHIIDGILIIDIVDGVSQYWRYTLNNLSVNLSVGLSSKIVSDVIVKQYKKYIFKQYFR